MAIPFPYLLPLRYEFVKVFNGWVGVGEVGGEVGGVGPDGTLNILFCLGMGVGAISFVLHPVPAGGLEDEFAVAVVCVICVAEVFVNLQIGNAALLLNLSQGCLANVFA